MAPAPLLPAYLIWGEDRGKIDEAVRRLVARMTREGALAPERFLASDTPAVDVVAACEALSFGGRRLVIVGEADAWKAADAEALVAYLRSLKPVKHKVPGPFATTDKPTAAYLSIIAPK